MPGGSSGGGGFDSKRLVGNVYDPVNIMGQSGSSPLDNILDPGGWWGINKEGAMGQPDLSSSAGPKKLPSLGIAPQFYDPNSFSPRDMGNGRYNDMAARLAGPAYDPRLLPMAKKGTGTQGPVRGQVMGAPGDGGGGGGGGAGFGISDLLAAMANRGMTRYRGVS